MPSLGRGGGSPPQQTGRWGSPQPGTSVVSISGSHTLIAGPAASASPGNLLEMQIPRPHPGPNNQIPWRQGLVICVV